MTTKRKISTVTTKTVTPRGARTLAGKGNSENLPPVSRQTAGGIAGAAIGGIVAGPLGSVVAGVAGALIGNASAAGDRPVMRTVESIRDITEKPARRAYKRLSAAIARHSGSRKKKSTTRKTHAKPLAKKAPARKTATRKPSKAKK